MKDHWTSDPSILAAGPLRASDADRERTAAALRRHHLDGRLDTDELQDRLGRCYGARTQGELHALLEDLPADEPTGRRRASRPGAGFGVRVLAVMLLVVAIAGTLAAAGAGHPGPLPFLALLVAFRLGHGRGGSWTAGGTRG